MTARRSAFLRDVLPPAGLIITVIALWAAAVAVMDLPRFVLPSPLDVVTAAWETRLRLVEAVGVTLTATGIGLVLSVAFGVLTAGLMDLFPLLRRALYPLLVASQTVQILAVAPLLVIWFGLGLTPNIVIVVLFTFFPLTVSVADGLTASDPDHASLLRAMGATRGQVWRMVRLPAALPGFFSGLKLAVTYSVVAATIGEWVGGSAGLGLYMLRSKNAIATDQVFAAMLITSLLSIGLFLIVTLIERLALPWYFAGARRDEWDEIGIF